MAVFKETFIYYIQEAESAENQESDLKIGVKKVLIAQFMCKDRALTGRSWDAETGVGDKWLEAFKNMEFSHNPRPLTGW